MKYAIFFLMLITASSFSCHQNKPKEIKVPVEIVKDEFKDWSINTKPKLEWTETDWMAKMLMSETPDSTDVEGLRLMGISAIVRADMYKIGIIDAIVYPRAYSGVNLESYIWWRAEPTSIHKQIAKDLVENGLKENDPRVYAFCNMSLISQSSKNWFNTLKFYKKIGEVTFFLLK